MATRARRITIEFAGDDAGAAKTIRGTGDDLDKLGTKLRLVGGDAKKGLGDVSDEADKLGSKLRTGGQKAGEALTSGVRKGVEGIGATLEEAGSTASDLFSGGFDIGAIADAISSKIGSLGAKGGKLMAGVAAVGVAAGAAFTVGLLQGMETEVSTDRLAAQLGGSEWAQSMGAVAGDLYLQGFGESVGDAGDALKKVLQNGLLSADSATDAQIEAMTAKLLTFTDVLEQDMDMSTQAVSTMLRNRLAKDGAEAFDVLTRGVQRGADRAGDLVETFQEYSTQFHLAGLTAADATGLMVQGLGAGARDADKVADAIKEFTIRGKDLADSTTEGYKAIGLSADDMREKVAGGGAGAREALDQVLDGLRDIEDPVKRNAAAVNLFGTQAEDLGDSLFALDLDTAARDLGTVEGATDGLGSAYDNASTKIENFKRNALAKLTEFVGNSVLPKLEQLQTWAQENPTAFKIVAGVVGGVLVTAFAAWAVSAATAAVATIAATWPVLAIGAAVIGLAALVVIHFDTIWRWISNVFNWVRDHWPLLFGILTGPIGLAVGFVIDNLDAVVGFVTGLPGRIASAARGLWDGLGSGLVAVLNWIIGKLNTALDAIDKAAGPFINFPSIPAVSGPVRPAFARSAGGGGSLRLAEGGIVRHRPGGVFANIAEGPDDEAVTPLPRNWERDGLGGGEQHTHVHIHGPVYGVDDLYETVNRGIATGQINNRGRRLTP